MNKWLGYLVEVVVCGVAFGVYWMVRERWNGQDGCGGAKEELEGPVKGPSEGCGSEKV